MIEATDQQGELSRQWAEALDGLEVRHPNGVSGVVLRLDGSDPLRLYVGLDETWCTLTGAHKVDFAISTVTLAFWPGLQLARQWFAAAWAGYCQHEALELVSLAGDRSVKPLDPHAEPYSSNPINRGLRDGFPRVLTPETLLDTLALVMRRADAEQLIRESMEATT